MISRAAVSILLLALPGHGGRADSKSTSTATGLDLIYTETLSVVIYSASTQVIMAASKKLIADSHDFHFR
ncbi:hypothetical protein J6590_042080 [Homalodisca vitripennis]|nr:hypothetical protein J6590_042080 [Homalodisca vitripennis]